MGRKRSVIIHAMSTRTAVLLLPCEGRGPDARSAPCFWRGSREALGLGSCLRRRTRSDAVRHDCGDKLGFVLANLALALEDPAIGEQVREAARGMLA